jgi:hypothetical protein
MSRWWLYVIEAVFSLIAFVLTMIAWVRMVEGWRQNILAACAALFSLGMAGFLCFQAVVARGDIVPRASNAIWVHVALIIWILTAGVIMGSRLWRTGK